MAWPPFGTLGPGRLPEVVRSKMKRIMRGPTCRGPSPAWCGASLAPCPPALAPPRVQRGASLALAPVRNSPRAAWALRPACRTVPNVCCKQAFGCIKYGFSTHQPLGTAKVSTHPRIRVHQNEHKSEAENSELDGAGPPFTDPSSSPQLAGPNPLRRQGWLQSVPAAVTRPCSHSRVSARAS